MPFEVLLTQIVNMPNKYLLKEGGGGGADNQVVAQFDKKLRDIKLPTMLLERLKKEFDENFEVSKRTSSVNSHGSGGGDKGQPENEGGSIKKLKSFFNKNIM
jgi:hypothetical protein